MLAHDPKYAALNIVKTKERVRLATIDVKSSQHWKSKYKMLRVLEPALVALRCADSDEASMDKIHFLTDCVLKNLVKLADELNNKELFPTLKDKDAGVDGVDLEREMVFGQTSDGREGEAMVASSPGNDEELGNND